MDARLVRLIHDYQDAVRRAIEFLEATGIPRPKSTNDWIGYDVPRTGELATGGKYFIHGFGCAVKTPEFCVDFDFGEHGEIDGIDFHRMENFARNHLQSKYGFADPSELHTSIKASCDAREMIYSGYILWYPRLELLGESKQNVDEPSNGPESPNSRFFNGWCALRPQIATVTYAELYQRNSPMTEKDQLINRVAKIEREVRFWRVLGAVAVGCFGLIITLGAGQNPETARLIRAKEFRLVDDDGNVRATLEARGNFTFFRMHDGTKQSEVSIVANNTNAGLHLYNDNRINSASIEAYPAGGGLGLSRKTGDGRALTQIVGGTDGTYAKFEPLDGAKVRMPSE